MTSTTRATKMEKLLLRAVRDDDADAFYRLGVRYLYGIGCNQYRPLGQIFLEKAAELGHMESFFLYHRIFSKGKKVIDDASYENIAQEWLRSWKADQSMLRYLQLGTLQQKKRIRRKYRRRIHSRKADCTPYMCHRQSWSWKNGDHPGENWTQRTKKRCKQSEHTL